MLAPFWRRYAAGRVETVLDLIRAICACRRHTRLRQSTSIRLNEIVQVVTVQRDSSEHGRAAPPVGATSKRAPAFGATSRFCRESCDVATELN